MARMRYIKPEFWTDGAIVGLSVWARLFYVGTWNFASCDAGHLADDPMGLKLKILPADPVDPVELLGELIAAGRIVRRFMPDGRSYLLIPRLPDHQKVDARWSTRCPYCAHEASAPVVTERSEEPKTHPAPPILPETPVSSPKLGLGGDGRGGDGIGEEIHPPDVQRAKARDRRATRIPDGFAATPDMVGWAKANTPNVGTRETEAFIDYWRGVPGTKGRKVDWAATWRNWMRRAEDDRARAPTGRGPARTLVEHNGLRLKPETVANLEGRARFEAMDQQQLAIEGTAS